MRALLRLRAHRGLQGLTGQAGQLDGGVPANAGPADKVYDSSVGLGSQMLYYIYLIIELLRCRSRFVTLA